jgi:hypothetical protein
MGLSFCLALGRVFIQDKLGAILTVDFKLGCSLGEANL